MRLTFLSKPEDLDWLATAHGIHVVGAVCAVVRGNEDSPDEVQLFSRDHYLCRPKVFRPTADRTAYVITQAGE
jgi:hypothetical protein